MRLIVLYKTILVAIAILLINGCERVGSFSLEPIEGFLQTPEGKYEFRNVSEKEAKAFGLFDSSRSSQLYLLSEGKDIKVFISYAARLQLIIATPKKKSILKTGSKNTYLQVDDGEMQPAYDKYTQPEITIERGLFTDPNQRNYYNAWINLFDFKGKISTGKIYRYHIPYQLNDNPYLVDLTFELKYKKKYRLSFGVPGTP